MWEILAERGWHNGRHRRPPASASLAGLSPEAGGNVVARARLGDRQGKTATSAQAQEARVHPRVLAELSDESVAKRIRINTVECDHRMRELMSQSDVDGALVGGASLELRVSPTLLKLASK